MRLHGAFHSPSDIFPHWCYKNLYFNCGVNKLLIKQNDLMQTLFTTGHSGIAVKISHCGVSEKVSVVPLFLVESFAGCQ